MLQLTDNILLIWEGGGTKAGHLPAYGKITSFHPGIHAKFLFPFHVL